LLPQNASALPVEFRSHRLAGVAILLIYVLAKQHQTLFS
jgi:lipid-A-disaccharide synthase-like uncharacterized protein